MKTLIHGIFIEAAQEACSPKHLADCGAFDDYSSKRTLVCLIFQWVPIIPITPWVSGGMQGFVSITNAACLGSTHGL